MTIYTVTKPLAIMWEKPEEGLSIGRRESQLLYGECFDVFDVKNGWAKGVSVHDGYEGFVQINELTEGEFLQTHYAACGLSHLYPAPDFKTHPVQSLPFLSHVHVTRTESGFAFDTLSEAWIFESHIRPQANTLSDLVKTAELFLGVPYLYGGRSALGIDCSGLVQLAVMAAGLSCKRDADMMEEDFDKYRVAAPYRRGDIIFFKGHVGIMVDESNILNATARTMDTRIERLDDLIGVYGALTSACRLDV